MTAADRECPVSGRGELLESCHEHPQNYSMAKPAVTPHCSSYRNDILKFETFSNARGFSEEKERAGSRAHLQEG